MEYTWLSVSDESYNVVADGLLQADESEKTDATKLNNAKAPEEAATQKGKKGFFSKLFRK